MTDELNLCEWRGEKLAESLSSCIRPKDHDGQHVVASSGRESVIYYEVDEEKNSLKSVIHAALKPGEMLEGEELAALWAIFPSGRGDYLDA